jgi:hypothetical protein
MKGAAAVETGAGFAALAGALVLNYYMGLYAHALGAHAQPAPDLLFRLLPLVDMRFFYVWGMGAFIALAAGAAVVREPKRLGSIALSFALLIAVRSVFITMTSLRLPYEALPITGYSIFDAVGTKLTFEHDLFFSSHTAMPFLAFLVYRGRGLKAVFLGFSFLMGATVLLSRLHYSIDVLAAFPITYAVHQADRRFLRRPYRVWKRRAGLA